MAFTNYEFPNSAYYDSDLRELVRLYKELTQTYDDLKQEIQETIDFVNNFESHADELIKEQIAVTMSLYQQRLLKCEQSIADLDAKLQVERGRIDGLYTKYGEAIQEITKRFGELQEEYEELLRLFHEYKNNLDSYIDNKIQVVQEYLEEKLVHLDRLDVINPYTSQLEDINEVLAQIVKYQSQAYGITAKEYDELGLTAWDYDRLQLTALEYDTKAYIKFWELTKLNMRNPFNGQITLMEDVINRLVDLHKTGLTAKDYDALQLTAKAYDEKSITAYDYDFNARAVLVGADRLGGA